MKSFFLVEIGGKPYRIQENTNEIEGNGWSLKAYQVSRGKTQVQNPGTLRHLFCQSGTAFHLTEAISFDGQRCIGAIKRIFTKCDLQKSDAIFWQYHESFESD